MYILYMYIFKHHQFIYPLVELCPSTALSHSQQVTNQPDTFDNKLFSGPASTTPDSQQAETHPEAGRIFQTFLNNLSYFIRTRRSGFVKLCGMKEVLSRGTRQIITLNVRRKVLRSFKFLEQMNVLLLREPSQKEHSSFFQLSYIYIGYKMEVQKFAMYDGA